MLSNFFLGTFTDGIDEKIQGHFFFHGYFFSFFSRVTPRFSRKKNTESKVHMFFLWSGCSVAECAAESMRGYGDVNKTVTIYFFSSNFKDNQRKKQILYRNYGSFEPNLSQTILLTKITLRSYKGSIYSLIAKLPRHRGFCNDFPNILRYWSFWAELFSLLVPHFYLCTHKRMTTNKRQFALKLSKRILSQ